MPDTLEDIAKPHAPEVKTRPPADSPSLVGVETVPVVANPEYMNFWFNESDELAMYDPDGRDVRLFNRTGDIFAELTEKVIEKQTNFQSRYAETGKLGSVRSWLHMIGPGNELVGGKDNLTTAGKLLLENIDSAPTEFDRQQVFTEAISSFLAAAKDTEDWATRRQLRAAALDTYTRFKEDKSYNWDAEDNGYLVDAEMLYDNVIFEQLIDDYHSNPKQEMSERNYKNAVVHYHKNSATRFIETLEKGDISNGKLFEWFYVLGIRNEQILTDEFDKYTVRSAMSHEDDYWRPKGFPRPEYEVGLDVIIDEYTQGKTHVREKIQIKGNNEDVRTYDPSIHVVRIDSRSISGTELRERMKNGAAAFVHRLNAEHDDRVRFNEDTQKAYDLARELLGY